MLQVGSLVLAQLVLLMSSYVELECLVFVSDVKCCSLVVFANCKLLTISYRS